MRTVMEECQGGCRDSRAWKKVEVSGKRSSLLFRHSQRMNVKVNVSPPRLQGEEKFIRDISHFYSL